MLYYKKSNKSKDIFYFILDSETEIPLLEKSKIKEYVHELIAELLINKIDKISVSDISNG